MARLTDSQDMRTNLCRGGEGNLHGMLVSFGDWGVTGQDDQSSEVQRQAHLATPSYGCTVHPTTCPVQRKLLLESNNSERMLSTKMGKLLKGASKNVGHEPKDEEPM